MNTALVTGARGFIAPHVATALRAQGVSRVVGHDLSPTPHPAYDGWLSGALDDPAVCADALRVAAPDLVVHLAGRFTGSDAELVRSNVATTRALLCALQDRPQCRLVVAGSAAEYGPPSHANGRLTETDPARPVTPYGAAKAEASALVLAHVAQGHHGVVARLFNVIGAGMSPALFLGALVTRLRDALRRGGTPIVPVGNMHVQRDFVAVEDAGRILAKLGTDPAAPTGLCNVASGHGTPLTVLAEALQAAAGVAVRFEREAHLVRAQDPPVIVGDPARVVSWLGEAPVPDLPRVVSATWAAA
jgi:GDP-4-dehydro-6-deoxy-D-mannose reductase